MRRHLLIVTFLVLLVRLPFVRQAVQLDDVYYLAGAQYAQTDPLHPHHAQYVFEGILADMRGHPHPPLDTWVLAMLIAAFGGIHIAAFHATYIAFSLIAALSVYWLARRFTPRPMLATVMFLAMPVFWIEGNSLMSDLPFLALWTAALALFLRAVDQQHEGFLAAAAAVLLLLGLTAYQASFIIPLLWLWLWRTRRDWTLAWYVATFPLLAGAGYQLFERLTSGTLPATVLTGYIHSYGLESALNKADNAIALTVHLAWLVCPVVAIYAFGRGRRFAVIAGTIAAAGAALYDPNPLFWASFGTGVLIICSLFTTMRTGDRKAVWLAAAALIFFGACLVVFFAGAARYLLPAAPLVVFIAVRRLSDRPHWLYAGVALQLALAASLAIVNYSQVGAWRSFAASMAPQIGGRRLWINGEWGFTWYLQKIGGRPVLRDQRIAPGDLIATSALGFPVHVSTPGVTLTLVREERIPPVLPVTVLGVHARSAYATAEGFGLRPFDIGSQPLDVIRVEEARAKPVDLSFLNMSDPGSSAQIVSGVYSVENGQWRWMGSQAVLILKSPNRPSRLEIRFFIPHNSPARHVTVSLDDRQVAGQTYPDAGGYIITTTLLQPAASSCAVTISVDKTFRVPGDQRDLGMILNSVGFLE